MLVYDVGSNKILRSCALSATTRHTEPAKLDILHLSKRNLRSLLVTESVLDGAESKHYDNARRASGPLVPYACLELL
jgi:hypothetical protein